VKEEEEVTVVTSAAFLFLLPVDITMAFEETFTNGKGGEGGVKLG